MSIDGQMGEREGQRSSGDSAQTQLDSTGRLFYALKGISGPGLRITGHTVKVQR